jgi:hypothetical protein
MLQVCREEIKNQIQSKSSSYVAVLADETTDVSNLQQMVIVLRYVYQGELFERFWSSAENFSKSILHELKEIGISQDQLMAQSYDGANVMSGKNNGVQVRIMKHIE